MGIIKEKKVEEEREGQREREYKTPHYTCAFIMRVCGYTDISKLVNTHYTLASPHEH